MTKLPPILQLWLVYTYYPFVDRPKRNSAHTRPKFDSIETAAAFLFRSTAADLPSTDPIMLRSTARPARPILITHAIQFNSICHCETRLPMKRAAITTRSDPRSLVPAPVPRPPQLELSL